MSRAEYIIAQSLLHSLYHNVTISEVVHVVLKSHQSSVWVDKRLIVILLIETLNLAFAYIRNRFVKFPHRRVKTGYLEGNLPHLVMDLGETLYTFRHRVRRSGELKSI